MDYPFGVATFTTKDGREVVCRNPCSSGLSFRRGQDAKINPTTGAVAILVLVDYPFGALFEEAFSAKASSSRNPCSSGLSFRRFFLRIEYDKILTSQSLF